MSVTTPVYLDCHATTPTDPRVVEKMLPFFTQNFGNAASSTHSYGWMAAEAVEKARKQVADSIGAKAKEIVFTSGGTEADNLALFGAFRMYGGEGSRIITTKVEHKAVLEACEVLEKRGADIVYLDVDEKGYVSPEAIESAINAKTILVSVIHGNNEVGAINDLKAIGKITRKNDVLLHTDAVQAFGKTDLSVDEMKIDLLSLSSHKIYGPKGVGALYVRSNDPKVKLEPMLFGGGQERGVRSGTLNVPAIVGFGEACEIAISEKQKDENKIRALRNRLIEGIKKEFPFVKVNGPGDLANNLSLTFEGFRAVDMIQGLPNIAFSLGSACSSGSAKPSYVLKSIGLSDELANATIRFGLGRFTSDEEVDFALQEVVNWVKSKRRAS